MVVVMRLFEKLALPSQGSRTVGALRAAAVISACALGAGCSANVARFDFPAFGLTEGDPGPSSPNYGGGSLLGDAGPQAGGSNDYTPPPRIDRRSDTAALPRNDDYRLSGPTSTPTYGGRNEPVATYDPAPPRYERRTADYAPPSRDTRYDGGPVTGGSAAGTITVARGDTLYGLSRRHGVSVESIMQANGMSNSMLRVGQTLVLPGASTPAAPVHRSPPRYAAPRPPVRETRTASAPSNWNGTHQVTTGDSLYAIARRYDVRVADLQRANGIDNPRALRPGQVLKVPGSGGDTSAPAFASAAQPASEARSRIFSAPPEMTPSASAPLPGQPQILNGDKPTRVAALTPQKPTVTDAGPTTNQVRTVAITPPKIEAPDGASKLRWPALGKIVSRFGPRPDGTHNDGVNIAVPEGAEVLAADDGVVAYAGSELKGYGNLVLVRHENGWVTAYAHNEKLLVKRGDAVKRGGVIAKAGRTGQVDTPQVHFELRQGAKPVDPVPYMERS